MRHPSLQYQIRMKLLNEKLVSASLDLMACEVDVQKFEKELEQARANRNLAIQKLAPFELAHSKLTNLAGGLYPWGLPQSISREEWATLTGEQLQGGN